jgi:hypothetical protein
MDILDQEQDKEGNFEVLLFSADFFQELRKLWNSLSDSHDKTVYLWIKSFDLIIESVKLKFLSYRNLLNFLFQKIQRNLILKLF